MRSISVFRVSVWCHYFIITDMAMRVVYGRITGRCTKGKYNSRVFNILGYDRTGCIVDSIRLVYRGGNIRPIVELLNGNDFQTIFYEQRVCRNDSTRVKALKQN